MNPGGVRADLTFLSSSAGEGDGNVTFGEAFTVQPFGNSLVTLTLTRTQIETLLEQQLTGCTNNQPFNRILSASQGFSYAWSLTGPACDKIDPTSIKLNNVVIDPQASYRVTVNSFLADGGDLFSVLVQGALTVWAAPRIAMLWKPISPRILRWHLVHWIVSGNCLSQARLIFAAGQLSSAVNLALPAVETYFVILFSSNCNNTDIKRT